MSNGQNSPCSQLKTEMVRLQNLINADQLKLNSGVSGTNRQDIEKALQIAQQELSALQQEYVTNGCTALPQMPKRVVNILMVTDGSSVHVASFGPGSPTDEYFGLSEVIRTLTSYGTGLSGVMMFKITKAHRDTDPGNFSAMSVADRALFQPDYQNFKFDQTGLDLNQFDEMWLFGVGGGVRGGAQGETAPLTDSELAEIAKFMDGGGGVFATGDHEDLGAPLCGRIPRVRTMRKWYVAGNSIPTELGSPPMAPAALGSSRNDTTRAGHDDPPPMPDGTPAFWFDNQSDDIPQTITPVTLTYVSPVTGLPETYTHPVLSTSAGPLDVLPDHMHEGEIITPWDMTMTVRSDAQEFVEYPVNADGSREQPVIIATGQVLKHVTDQQLAHGSDAAEVQARSFGVIGAYDGNETDRGVGRVVVDSTRHHFFDINLIGDPQAAMGGVDFMPGGQAEDPTKAKGFTASGSGLATLGKIKAYYVSTGIWLARQHAPRVQGPLHVLPHWFVRAVYKLRTSQPLSMSVRKGIKYSSENIWNHGSNGAETVCFGRDAGGVATRLFAAAARK